MTVVSFVADSGDPSEMFPRNHLYRLRRLPGSQPAVVPFTLVVLLNNIQLLSLWRKSSRLLCHIRKQGKGLDFPRHLSQVKHHNKFACEAREPVNWEPTIRWITGDSKRKIFSSKVSLGVRLDDS